MSLSMRLVLSLLALSAATNAQSVSPPTNAAQASSISKVLDPSFAGLGIEPSNLFSFTGGSTPNQLSVTLLQNLADYAGQPPHLRIGGNTGDYMIYDSSFSDFSILNNPAPTGQGDFASDLYIFGPKYWEALNRFPKNTPITFGLNLAYEGSDYRDKIVTEAKAAIAGLTNAKLVSFEIGNEPDLYLKNGFRTGDWGGTVYTQQWLDRAAVVWQQALQPANLSADFFEAASTASTIGTTFEVSILDAAGIRNGSNGAATFLAGWNQHDYYYFVSVSKYGLTLDYMLQLQTTETQFDYWTSQVRQAIATGVPYYLREMASAGPIGIAGISDTFGAAL